MDRWTCSQCVTTSASIDQDLICQRRFHMDSKESLIGGSIIDKADKVRYGYLPHGSQSNLDVDYPSCNAATVSFT